MYMHHVSFSLHVLEKNVSSSIFKHFEACNLAGPYTRWHIGHNERESCFSIERETWFYKVWDILMIEGLFLVRAPFNNSVELNSEMLSARICSVMSWFSREKKKKELEVWQGLTLFIFAYKERQDSLLLCSHCTHC